jgi:hypothetical protein
MSPTPEEAVKRYPPSSVYELLARTGGSYNNGQRLGTNSYRRDLVEAYNAGPVNYEGILVRDTTAHIDGEPVAITVVNDAHPDLEIGRPRSGAVIEIGDFTIAPGEIREQSGRLPAWRPLGRMAILAAASLGGAYAMAGQHVSLSTPVLLAGPIVHAATRSVGNSIRQRRATKTLTQFNDWMDKPENGAHIFRAANQVDVPLSPLEDILPEVARAGLTGLRSQPYDHLNLRGDPGKEFLRVRPAKLVKDLLQNSHAPAVLWADGFGDQVSRLAELEQTHCSLTQKLTQAQNRQAFTGYVNSDEIPRLQAQIAECSADLAQTSLVLLQQARGQAAAQAEVARIEHAKQLMDGIAFPDLSLPHRLEMHLQVFHDIAARAIADSLAVERTDSDVIAGAVGTYLRDCRQHFTSPDHAKQLYHGMKQKFGDTLKLPEWKDVEPKLPQIAP